MPRLTIPWCLCCVLGAADLHIDLTGDVRLRPGETRIIPWHADGTDFGDTLVYSGSATQMAITLNGGPASGTITLKSKVNTFVSGGFSFRLENNGVPSSNSRNLNWIVDPPPTISSPTTAVTVAEDREISLTTVFFDADNITCQVVQSPNLLAGSVAPLGNKSFSISIQSDPDWNGSTSLVLRVTDAYGPTDLPVAVTVTRVNDGPRVEGQAVEPAVIDPLGGQPLALLTSSSLVEKANEDTTRLAVTVGTTTKRLAVQADIEGMDGIDLLSLASTSTHRISGANVIRIDGGATVATWSRTDNNSRKLRMVLSASGNLEDAAALPLLLRASHLGAPDAPLSRRLRLVVEEPNANGTYAAGDPVDLPYTVAAAVRPPIAALSVDECRPLGTASLRLTLTGADPATLQVRAIGTPLGGRIEPSACTGQEAIAGMMRYRHEAGDIADDQVTVRVSDAQGRTTTVSAPVRIRAVPDRLSILSDPRLSVARGDPAPWPITTLPAGAALSIVPWGAPLPAPVGVAVGGDGASLVIDWSAVPEQAHWLAFAVQAVTSDTTLAPARRTAVQRMLVRILPRTPDQ